MGAAISQDLVVVMSHSAASPSIHLEIILYFHAIFHGFHQLIYLVQLGQEATRVKRHLAHEAMIYRHLSQVVQSVRKGVRVS